MTAYEVPLTPEPQTFTVELGSTLYALTLKWCDAAACWILDIALVGVTTPLVAGIPLVTGTDLLGQYAYLGIGGSLYVQSLSVRDSVPTFTSLGSDGLLFFVTP